MPMLSCSPDLPVGRRWDQGDSIVMLPIAILALLYGSLFTPGTIQGELLIMAMLTSLCSLQLARSPDTSQLADELQILAMATLATIAVLHLLA
ncbi:hypothetical protein [Vreelandella jeotgali]|uniref:hypothetical protein n=1 Tax=Vreelandella jeotgali TaxID=553386 RepID=UPI000376071D|nr:hypothetical protein [Halomonas jeotgali]